MTKARVPQKLPCLSFIWRNTMALELQRLVEKVAHMDIHLLAGEGGIHNLVTWVHMVETAEASDFLDGGEVAILTGLGLNGPDDLIDLVNFMYEKKIAGLIINIGPFIEEIPQEVLDFCNEVNLPLFVVPWKIHLAEIMRIFCFALTRDEQKLLQTAATFKNAIFFPKQEELYVISLSQQGFSPDWKYSVCMMHLRSQNKISTDRLEKFTINLNTYAQHKYKNIATFLNDSEILIVCGNYKEEEVKSFIQELYAYGTRILASGESLSAGCGKLTQSIRCLWKSYKQAKSIQKLQKNGKCLDDLTFYSDMGIYKLLMSIDDRDIMEEYYEKTVLPLREYDEKNNTDLAVVLCAYLNHNGSVKDTADELFVHRNTINYKLTKISELLHMDLSQLSTRLLLGVGFMLEDMF